MRNEKICLPRSLVLDILHQAQASPEREICGLISAKGGQAYACYPVPNVAADPTRAFQLDPRRQIEIMSAWRACGESLYAIYHSHPHAPAVPSTADVQQFAYPGAYYLIVSLNTQGVLEMRGFATTPPFTEIPLLCTDARVDES